MSVRIEYAPPPPPTTQPVLGVIAECQVSPVDKLVFTRFAESADAYSYVRIASYHCQDVTNSVYMDKANFDSFIEALIELRNEGIPTNTERDWLA